MKKETTTPTRQNPLGQRQQEVSGKPACPSTFGKPDLLRCTQQQNKLSNCQRHVWSSNAEKCCFPSRSIVTQHSEMYRAEVVPAGTVLVTRYVESVEYSVPRIAAAQQARLVPLSAAKSMGKSKSEGALEVPRRPQELAQAVGRPSVSAHGPSPFRKSNSLAAITRFPEQRQSRTAPKLENMRGFEMKTFASAVELKVDDGAMGAIASKLNLRDMARSRRQNALAAEVERLTVERMQERYDKLRASTAAAASRCDWRAMNDAISEQISMARKRDAAPLYASRSFCCRKSSLLPQSLVDASYAVSRAPHSPVGFYRRSAALAEQALQAATLDKKLEKRGDAGEALLESLSRAGLPGPAVDKAGFSDIEVRVSGLGWLGEGGVEGEGEGEGGG